MIELDDLLALEPGQRVAVVVSDLDGVRPESRARVYEGEVLSVAPMGWPYAGRHRDYHPGDYVLRVRPDEGSLEHLGVEVGREPIAIFYGWLIESVEVL